MADYDIPRFGGSASQLHGWLMNAVAEGAAWLAAQRPAQSWAEVKTILSNPSGSEPGAQSSVGYNKVKRTSRELVASLAGFRHEGEIKARWDADLYTTAHALTQLDANWYKKTRAHRAHRAGIQNAVNFGTGYLYETWDKNFYGPGLGDIRLDALDPATSPLCNCPEITTSSAPTR